MKIFSSPRRYLLFFMVFVLSGCNLPAFTASRTPTPSAFLPEASRVSPLAPGTPAGQAILPPDTPAQAVPTNPVFQIPQSTIAYQPSFREAPCEFPVPAGYNPVCGYLVVPEDRTRSDSPPIRLHVAVFRSRAEHPAPDPVIHLAGGPGSSSLEVAEYVLQQGLDAILESRDLIFFDQRGTGYSQPRLDCPERELLTPRLLDGSLTGEQAEQEIRQAFAQCRQRLQAAGINLAAYNSASSAADIGDLRRALGYEQLNLYGVSYGTRLALTVLRDQPEFVRSAVLDSAYPLQVNLYTSLAPNAERAFRVFFDRCAADASCNANYPDLEQVFYGLVDRLNAEPLGITLSAGQSEYPIQVDGNLLIDVLFVGLYNPRVAASMPGMIFAIQRGDYDLLEQRLWLYFASTTALGMQISVQCAEEIPFSGSQEAIVAAEGVRPEIAAFFPQSVKPLFAVCQDWTPGPLDPSENEPVHSAVPTLVLAGEGDPITPPDWGRLVAGDLSQAYFYEFPGQGHWVTRSSPCSVQMALAFWQHPGQEPDASCLDRID